MEAAAEDGDDLPEALTDRPALNPALAGYWRGFILLTGDRPAGMGIGPIPTTSVLAYARDVEGAAEPASLREWLRMIRAVDDEYLRAEAAKETKPP